MALNLSAEVLADLELAVALAKNIEKAVAAGGTMATEGMDLVALSIADPDVKAAIAAVIAAI